MAHLYSRLFMVLGAMFSFFAPGVFQIIKQPRTDCVVSASLQARVLAWHQSGQRLNKQSNELQKKIQ